jgi:pyruvate formate lyase activating enzyme
LSFLLELLDACRSEGIRSAIETSGFTALDSLVDVARRTDLLLYDLKTADPLRGVELTGVDYRRSLDNLSALAMASAADPSLADIVVRMPLVPGMNDSSADLEAAIAFVAALGRDKEGCGSGAEIKAGRVERSYEVHLLPYHSAAKGKYGLWGLDFPLAETKAPDAESLEKAIALFAAGGIAARIGG